MKRLFFIIIVLLFTRSALADNLGRLFTTPYERVQLERLRNKKPEPIIAEQVNIDEIVKPDTEDANPVARDAIILKGLVHRSDGKNSAWINDSNTFEGDLESQYIEVKQNDIYEDNVRIIMPDKSTVIDLKVGQGYEPELEQVFDPQEN